MKDSNSDKPENDFASDIKLEKEDSILKDIVDMNEEEFEEYLAMRAKLLEDSTLGSSTKDIFNSSKNLKYSTSEILLDTSSEVSISKKKSKKKKKKPKEQQYQDHKKILKTLEDRNEKKKKSSSKNKKEEKVCK